MEALLPRSQQRLLRNTTTSTLLTAYAHTMTRPLIAGAAPLRAFRTLVALVLTSTFPLQTLLASPYHRIQLRTIEGRRRSYLCYAAGNRVTKRAPPRRSPTPPSSPGSSRRSSRSRSGSPETTAAPRRLADWAPGLPYDAPLGLRNGTGVYCYRRALMQCLAHLPLLHHELVERDLHADCPKEYDECVACAFKDFLQCYWADRGPQNFPDGVLHNFDTAMNASDVEGKCDFANATTQGACDEFFTYLMARLRETDDELSDAVDRVFGHVYREHMVCADCGLKRERDLEVDIGIEVGLRKPQRGEKLTLTDLLRHDLGQKVIENYKCESEACIAMRMTPERDAQLGTRSPAPEMKRELQCHWTVAQAPQMLAIKLKRSQYDLATGIVFKVGADVDFKEVLNLGEFTEDGEDVKYRLYGVVAHSGGTTSSGHYIAAVRHRNGTEFRTIDDAHVLPPTALGFADLRTPWSGRYFDPLILLYLKVEDKEQTES